MSGNPRVSVVVPTLRRPALLLRALGSVFRQTVTDIEIIVVVDGPDPATQDALKGVDDTRMRVISNERSLTAAGARNAGAAIARGDWIAFLDDDDEWLPNKLEAQLAIGGTQPSVLVSCLSHVITPIATYTWPRVIYDNSAPIDEYLFVRQGAFAGGAYLQTSSFLLPLALFKKCPFPLGSEHDDWEFVIRLCKEFGVKIEVVREPLVVLYMEERRESLSQNSSYRRSMDWLERVRPLLTRRGYSGFCLGVVGPRAAGERAYSAFFPLLYRALRYGSPGAWQVASYLAFWGVPQDMRRRIRALSRKRSAADS